jgi:hypothetical protein
MRQFTESRCDEEGLLVLVLVALGHLQVAGVSPAARAGEPSGATSM